ncbi:YopX family protein [Streptococcus suis]|uniref:YopX family protein n=1 Tax=Streptococcus suis TaxID=1307 RepID=UPI000CF3817B|nr:YopX family protein [Streptococcus suis]
MIPKFRVWDTVKKAMSEVQAIVYTEERVYPVYSKVIRRYIPFSEAVLMQSTGKMDSTGQVEVYVGDILYYPDQDEDNYGIIKFDEDKLAFVLDNGYERYIYGDYGMGKVIGNIYKNPELVEG